MRYSRAEARAVDAVQTRQSRVQAAETSRAFVWTLIPAKDRQRAASVAGLAGARGLEPLESLTDAERARIRFALESHIHNMQIALACMWSSQSDASGYVLVPRKSS